MCPKPWVSKLCMKHKIFLKILGYSCYINIFKSVNQDISSISYECFDCSSTKNVVSQSHNCDSSHSEKRVAYPNSCSQPSLAISGLWWVWVILTIFNSQSLQQRVIIIITPVYRWKNWVTERWSDSPKSRTESIAELGIERRIPCLIHRSPQIISFYKCSIFVKTSVL